MERSWWWKTIALLLLIVAAIVVLLPTVVGHDHLPQWLAKRIDAKLNLGLDLQGGIHLVYEVEVDKAVSDKADRLAADIEEKLKNEKKVAVQVTRDGRDTITIEFPNKADLGKLDKDFLADYQTNLTEVSRDDGAGKAIFEMDTEYIDEVVSYAITQAEQTIRGRIDEFGVAEPTILKKGRDIVVELPGLDKNDQERVTRLIGRTAQLEFKMVDDENDFMDKVAAKVETNSGILVRTDTYDGRQHGAISYTYLEARNKDTLKKFLDRLPSMDLKVPSTHQILMGEEEATDEKGNPLPDKIWKTYLVKSRTELTGDYLTDAVVQFNDRTKQPEVGITLDTAGATIFEKLSGDNIGRRMAIVLDDTVNSAPVFNSRIPGGRAVITLGGSRDAMQIQEEARDLASVLRTGALPAPLRKTFERWVGPTLGQDAIRGGMLAFWVGSIVVVLFMIYYYRWSGVICDIALLMNILFLTAVLAGFQGTLTLPGIAGLVLTIGMAVDTNVLIYERIREELAIGKTPRAAVEAGYNRAFWSVFDSQLTTAIAGVVLWQYGSGPIRGFALTLLIGIATSMFTGIFVTRIIFDFVLAKFKPTRLSI